MSAAATGTDEIAALLRGDRALYAKLHEFNLLLSRGVHESWHAALFPPPLQPLLARADALDARVHAHLSAHLLAGSPLGERFFWRHTPAVALALLAPAALLELARRIGAGLASATLRQLLPGAAATAARRALGEALHDFALQRAPLLVTQADQAWEPARRVDFTQERAGASVDALGAATLKAAWDEDGLWDRARLKLPRALAQAAESLPAAPRATSTRLALRIARENDPRWPTSFAPASA